MPIFLLFISAGVLLDGAFSLWISLMSCDFCVISTLRSRCCGSSLEADSPQSWSFYFVFAFRIYSTSVTIYRPNKNIIQIESINNNLIVMLSSLPSNANSFKYSQIFVDFIWGGTELQIFGLIDLMLLLPKITWLTLVMSRLSLY